MIRKLTTFSLLLILNLSIRSSNVFAKNIPNQDGPTTIVYVNNSVLLTLLTPPVIAPYSSNNIVKEQSSDNPPQCPSKIYCHGELLHTVQMAHVFADSKTFVDMSLKNPPNETLKKFDLFMESKNNNPTREQIKDFVESNFLERGSELTPETPSDWHENPRFLDLIKDPNYRQWGSDLNSLWSILGRKMIDNVKEHPELYSIIFVPNLVIVPGGRFLEFYYWDTYWIIRGLLFCEMYDTARGMIENFLHVVENYGFIPNGGRIYYSGRSQPPLLIPMVESYVEFSKDIEFAVKHVSLMEKEFQYWMEKHVIEVNGHEMYRYVENTTGPRPESYREDIETAKMFATEQEKEDCYSELKAAAESGMDFSSRWFINKAGENKGSLMDLKTRYIIPVELNAILYWNANLLSKFFGYAKNEEKSVIYKRIAQKIYEGVQTILWDEEDGMWYDYDIMYKKHRKYFSPTNVAPLWTNCFDFTKSEEISKSVLNNLVNVSRLDDFPGGVPNTLEPTGEQWDFPNVWPPMQYILIKSIERLNTPEAKSLAFNWTKRWVGSNFKAYEDGRHMYEKYNAEKFGGHGSGGEYEVQTGFGWSNGVIIELLSQYGDKLGDSK